MHSGSNNHGEAVAAAVEIAFRLQQEQTPQGVSDLFKTSTSELLRNKTNHHQHSGAPFEKAADR